MSFHIMYYNLLFYIIVEFVLLYFFLDCANMYTNFTLFNHRPPAILISRDSVYHQKVRSE